MTTHPVRSPRWRRHTPTGHPRRSTGIGAGLGVGRMGAIIGPTLASMLLGYGWSARDLFLAAAVPPLIAAAAMLGWNFFVGTGTAADAKTPVAAN